MAGVPIPATTITDDTFAVRPAGAVDDSLRVLFVHGGGSTDANDKSTSPHATYLRALQALSHALRAPHVRL